MNASEPREDAVADDLLLQAIARGWCAPECAQKVVDPILAFAITKEVRAYIAALAQQGAEPVAWQRAVDEADAAELFSDGLSGDLHSAGIDTIEAAYMEGRKNVIQEIRDLAREKAATGAPR